MPESEAGIHAVEYDAYGGPDVLQLRRIAAPQPAPGEVVVKVHAASVNPVDWKVRSGLLQKCFPIAFPAITGRDAAGEVVAAGSDADIALIGQRVCFLAPRGVGTWSQRVALPESMTVAIPSTLSYEHAAALPLAGISAMVGIVQTAKVNAGMRVLIHAAAGGVGSIAVQLAHMRGATVIATCSEHNLDFVRDLGAREVIAYDKTAFEEQVRDVDVVFDLVGGDVHRRSYQVLRPGGMMVCLAAAPYEDQSAQFGVKIIMPHVPEDRTTLASVVELAAAGKIRPSVEQVLPLSDFAKAQNMSQTGHARGKTVLAF
jgi:NADPH:quinone reductase-like Zn-dependent oxidoreductase